ncbi:MAG: DNRLRE domain-containing protein [Bacteroidia bacterium]
MKNLVKSFVILTGLLTSVVAQTTLTLRPNAATGKDATITSLTAGSNYGTDPDLAAIAWTNGGNSFIERGLVGFDLSSIPQNAIISGATLSLYCNPASTNTQLNSGSNSCLLQRITSTWTEAAVTWNNQPATTSVNQVTLLQSTSTTQNYPNIDVTNLVTDMINNPSTSFGFMLKLSNETTYRSMVMSSSDHSDSTKRPMLIITYTVPAPCTNSVVIKPNATVGKDATITSLSPNLNYGSDPDFASIAWTNGGTSFVERALISFDLSSVPQNAVITTATLSLYSNPVSTNTQLSTGVNVCLLQRITSTWTESGVTWSNQPTTTAVNQVALAQSNSTTQDYPNIDVTNLVIDMKNNPATSFGLMMQLQTEQNYRSMVLASSDHSDSTRWPKLVICYTPNTGLNNLVKEISITVFPNPSPGNFTVQFENNSVPFNLKIFNINGQLIDERQGIRENELQINNDHLANNKGIYFIEIASQGSVYRRKIAVL